MYESSFFSLYESDLQSPNKRWRRRTRSRTCTTSSCAPLAHSPLRRQSIQQRLLLFTPSQSALPPACPIQPPPSLSLSLISDKIFKASLFGSILLPLLLLSLLLAEDGRLSPPSPSRIPPRPGRRRRKFGSRTKHHTTFSSALLSLSLSLSLSISLLLSLSLYLSLLLSLSLSPLFLFRFGPHTRSRRGRHYRKMPTALPPSLVSRRACRHPSSLRTSPSVAASSFLSQPACPSARLPIGLGSRRRCRRRHPRRYHALPHLVSADRCGLLTHSLVQRAPARPRPWQRPLSLPPHSSCSCSAPSAASPLPAASSALEVGSGGGGEDGGRPTERAGGRRRDNKAGDDESSERDLRSLARCSALTSPVFSHLLKAAREGSKQRDKDMLEFGNISGGQPSRR